MIQKILLILIAFFILQSCNVETSGISKNNVETSGIWTNSNIEKEKKGQLKALNDRLFNAVGNDDAVSLKGMMSDSLLHQSGGDIQTFVNQVNAAFKTNSYRVLDEYYINNSTTRLVSTIPSTGDNGYVISYLAVNKETFVSLLLPNELDNETLILAIYGNYDGEWKLNILKAGQYSLLKKNALDYYKLANDFYDKRYLIDAYTNINLAERLLRPGHEIFTFQKDKEINEFNDKIKKELNASFPLPLMLDNVSSKPKIFRIYPEMSDEGFGPMVQYLTNINLNDTISIKIENEKVKKEVKRIFKGIDQNKNYIFFQAFNEIPDGQKPVKHYGFIDHLTQ